MTRFNHWPDTEMQTDMEIPTRIVATPLFVHKSRPENFDTSNSCSSDGEEKSLQSLSVKPKTQNSEGRERRVIDSIVTAVPYSYSSRHGQDRFDCNSNGEVQVCIEEYVSIDGNINTTPLLRRVAVRTHGDITSNGEGGLLQASFSLPVSPLPRQGEAVTNNKKNWLCWTRFQKNSKSAIATPSLVEKPYLCALTGPKTLRIFDVYPNPKTDAESVIGVGEGHTVSLPFEASSIFALPSPYGGLLIQRAIGMGEDTHFNFNPQQQQQQQSDRDLAYCPHGIKGGDEVKSTTKSSSRTFDFIVEGPPSTVRLGSLTKDNNNGTSKHTYSKPPLSSSSITPTSVPHRQHQQLHPRFSMNEKFSPSSSSCSSDSEIDRIVVSPPHISQRVAVESTTNIPSLSPSVYSLHHPLDEVRECVIIPHPEISETDSDPYSSDCRVWRKKLPKREAPILSFCNNFERIIHVEKPRFFRKKNKRDSNAKQSDKDVMVVTWNVKKRCHGVWILNEAPPPPPPEPLWKMTSTRGNIEDVPSSLRSRNRLSVGVTNDAECDTNLRMTDEEEKAEVFCQRDTSPFSDLHANISMTCIHSTSWEDEYNTMLESELCEQHQASSAFLATTCDGLGDFILCLLIQSEEPTNDDKMSVLKCLTFDPIYDNDAGKVPAWELKAEYEIPCKSAQPIQATDIHLESFPMLSRDNPMFSWYRRCGMHGYETPKAFDILTCSTPNEGSSTLSLFRGKIHLSDFSIPVPATSGVTPRPFHALRNAVRNRVDIHCGCSQTNTNQITIRASFSLASTNSAITDLAISAIGSALQDESSSGNATLLQLYFDIRADCVKLAQYRSRKMSSLHSINDLEWDSFTIIIASFLAAASGSNLDLNHDSSGAATVNEDDDEVWFDLLKSDFHAEYTQKNGNRLFLDKSLHTSDRAIQDYAEFITHCECVKWVCNQSDATLSIASSRIFDALHILYEDLKIRRSSNSISRAWLLGDFLHSLCECSTSSGGDQLMSDFAMHYEQDRSPIVNNLSKIYSEGGLRILRRISTSDRPFCAYSWFEAIMEGHVTNSHFEINGTCWRLGALLLFYTILFGDSSTKQRERDRKLVLTIVQAGLVDPSSLFDSFPPSLSLPLMDALHRCRSDPPHLNSGWNASAYDLIGRNDLAKIKSKAKPMKTKDSSDVTGAFPKDDPENDGLVSIEKYAAMLFPNDSRIREAARLLRSSRPVFLRVQRAVEVNDHDYERMKQQKLALLCRRVLPLPVGRGMMTIGTLGKIPIEALPIPRICLSGRIPPQNAILALEENRCTSKHKMWPDFHNGVATGLQLPLASEGGKRKITRTWIVCNKPNPTQNNSSQPNQPNSVPEPDHSYGGFLLALGLRGHLASLSNNDIVDFINKGPFTTAVGVMLGLAANKRGTCDMTLSKTLCVHIPSLLPNSYQSIDLASPVQTAAVTGVGLLYQGSAHRLLTEFLLNEMSKKPTVDQNTDDREGYTLCCGLALGMVNLCLRGGSTKSVNDGLSDLNIEERLHRYIVGGIEENSTRLRNRNAERTSNGMNTENEKSSRIYEGNMINVDITAPGATLALAMIYHRSGSKSVASLLSLPSTAFALDNLRPDFLFLRVVSKSLVLWDDIKPDESWIQSQIPKFIRHSYVRFKRKAEKTSGLDGLATFAAMSMEGNCDSDKEMVDDTDRHAKPDTNNNDSSNCQNLTQHEDADIQVNYTAIRQAHAYITAGVCFSIGLRYAGTGNSVASRSISVKILELQKLRDDSDPISSALRPDMPTVELCLGASALALGMVMAGTGDIDSFKLLKKLRWKCEMDVKYGNHMAYASAIGLLFLGGGTCTLGNEPADIAALLIAFFPRYPVFTHDNRYHLQALRHLYALAVRKRKIEAIDVDSNEKVLVPMELDFGDGSPSNIMTPSILLNRGKTCKIKVTSERYYPVEVVLEDVPAFNTTLSLFVKKKSGRLSHIQDPHGLPSLFAQAGRDRLAALDFIKSFIEDRGIIAYANYICSSNDTGCLLKKMSKDVSMPSLNLGEFCVDIIQECLRDEKTDAITTYLALYNALHSIGKDAWPSRTTRDFRLLRTFYQSSDRFELVSPLFIAMLCEKTDKFFSSVKVCEEGRLGSKEDSRSRDSRAGFGAFWKGPMSIWLAPAASGI